MNQKLLFGISFLSVVIAVIMYVVGSDSSHLSELADFYWVPLPLGIICMVAGLIKKK